MTTWELWDTESNNLVESFEHVDDVRAAVLSIPDRSGLALAVRDERGKTTWIDLDQAYYWAEAWQAGEREMAAEIAAGQTRHFETAKEAIQWLQSDDE